jgi:serine/threonine-protein kinase
MDDRKAGTPFDETVEIRRRRGKRPDAGGAAMAFVEGTAPELSNETNDLLRRRLRSASLLLFAGFLAYFVRHLFFLGRLETAIDWLTFYSHASMTVITGIVGLRLCANCPVVLRHLRVAELIVFGGSALFFLLLSYEQLTRSAAKGYFIPIAQIWLLLIFTYALFIPNTLRRATVIISTLAVIPVALMIAVLFTSPDFNRVLRTNPDFTGYITQVAMLMALSAASAIWGAYTIGSLRKEAFEARQLGQYRLKEQLGKGGMGEVYLGEHLLLKRPCAIKLIQPDKAGDVRALARFEREVRATAKLTHWNTIEIYDYGRADDGTFYYAMEYLPGLNLGQLVEMHGPLPTERVIHLLMQTCDALSEAHHQNLIHRDIKPGNIFAARRGGVYDVAKLLDFGLAKPLTNVAGTAITLEGTITGSPLFMSPEQATGDGEADARSDIYSLGAVAYYLLTGVPPFDSDRPLQVILAHARDEPRPPSDHNPAVPEDVEHVVLQCLDKDPDRRFQSAANLQQALGECAAAGRWTREMAAQWWEQHGCPKKKALDAAVLQSATA